MAVSGNFALYIEDQLAEFRPFESKRMFGGIGFFKDGLMFGMIASDVFRLKVDASNQAEYEAHGMKPFYSGTKKKGMPYWEVPPTVIEDPSTLAQWALKSFEAAKAGAAKK